MRVLSLFSGIGGFDEGLRQAGCEIAACCEIDANCRQVLERHFSRVPIFTDIKQLTKQELINEGVLGDGKPIDLICGGFPCQDLSVAGNRAGLAGERSGLFFDFMRIVDAVSPRWVLIENVPGLLSSNGGRDMGTVIGALAKLGYGYAYRTMDAQYFGVAQRRRRVFIVGHLGEPWSAPAEVLFESESCERDTPPSREKRPDITQALTEGFGKGGPDDNLAQGGFLVPEVAKTLNTSCQRMEGENETFVIQDAAMPREKKQSGIGITANGPCYALDCHGAHAVAHTLRARGFDASENGTGRVTPIVAQVILDKAYGFSAGQSPKAGSLGFQEEITPTLRAGASGTNMTPTILQPQMTVRRLTPLECERLQGFEDGWTEGHSDSARYRMLGNAVCMPVAKWLGERIRQVTGQ